MAEEAPGVRCEFKWLRNDAGGCIEVNSLAAHASSFFVFATLGIAFAHIRSHLKYSHQRMLTKYTIRILLMPPIYGSECWLALRFPQHAVPYRLLREGYEAFVIFSFMQFLLAYLGGAVPLARRLNLKRRLAGHKGQKHWFPFHFLKPWKLGAQFVRLTLLGTLQYVPASLFVMLLSITAWSMNTYHDGKWAWKDAYWICAVVTNCSQTWSLYCLVLFYHALHDELKPLKPFSKFLAVKLVVFFTYWQSLTIGILQKMEGEGGVLDEMGDALRASDDAMPTSIDPSADPSSMVEAMHAAAMAPHAPLPSSHSSSSGSGGDDEVLGNTLQNFIICVEMFCFAIGHVYAFPADEFALRRPSYSRLSSTSHHADTRLSTGSRSSSSGGSSSSPLREARLGHTRDSRLYSSSKSHLETSYHDHSFNADYWAEETDADDYDEDDDSEDVSISRSPDSSPQDTPPQSRPSPPPSSSASAGPGHEQQQGTRSARWQTRRKTLLASQQRAAAAARNGQNQPQQQQQQLEDSLLPGGAFDSDSSSSSAHTGTSTLESTGGTPRDYNGSGLSSGSNAAALLLDDRTGDGDSEGEDDDGSAYELLPVEPGSAGANFHVRHVLSGVTLQASELSTRVREGFREEVAFLRASGSLVGQSVAAVPRDVGLALRDGGRRVGDAAIALPRGVGRAAAESGRRVGEVRSAEGASLHDVAAACGHVPLSIARSFGTGVVDLARNTVELPARSLGVAAFGTVNVGKVAATQVLRTLSVLPPLHKHAFREGINFTDVLKAIQTVTYLEVEEERSQLLDFFEDQNSAWDVRAYSSDWSGTDEEDDGMSGIDSSGRGKSV